MTNKKLGNDFEAQFCEILFDEGFWVHNMAQNASGQPADVIAVRNGKTYLIDCKVCSNRGFTLSRMEDNQDLSMEHWQDCGNGEGWFAILLRDSTIYMVKHSTIRDLAKVQSSVNEQEIHRVGLALIDWLRLVC